MNGGQHVPFDAAQYSFFGDLENEGGGLEGGLEDALEVGGPLRQQRFVPWPLSCHKSVRCSSDMGLNRTEWRCRPRRFWRAGWRSTMWAC